jgi:hypothetical protein
MNMGLTFPNARRDGRFRKQGIILGTKQKNEMKVETIKDLKKALRDGPYAWPGGYPCYFITDDGAALSFDAVKEELKRIMWSIKTEDRGGWRVIGLDVNYEDPSLFCAHTNKRIPSAYAEDEAEAITKR